MTLLSRLKLFSSIVWRDYEGSPLDWKTAWRVAGITHPSLQQQLLTERQLTHSLQSCNDTMQDILNDSLKAEKSKDEGIVKLQAQIDALEEPCIADELPDERAPKEHMPFCTCCDEGWTKGRKVKIVSFVHCDHLTTLPASPNPSTDVKLGDPTTFQAGESDDSPALATESEEISSWLESQS